MWQRTNVPTTLEGRKTYEIAAKYEQRFSRAFLEVVRSMLTPAIAKEFKKAWKTHRTREVMNVFPFFRAGARKIPEVWVKFQDKLIEAYAVVVQESGNFAAKEMSEDFQLNIQFTLIDKEEKPKIPVVPINPYSAKWIEKRALDLIQKDITEQQREVVREIIKEGFKKGLRAEVVYQDVKKNIGLTERWAKAVENRRQLLLESGMKASLVEKRVDAYREKLLLKRAQMIARTETITAQAQGRRDAWRSAEGAGLLPPVERVWITAPSGCKICIALDGETAPLDEPYETEQGTFMGPTAHPHCRCTERLRRKAE